MAIAIDELGACDEFLAAAGGFLAAREAEHNLMLGLCSTMVAHPEVYPGPWFAIARDGEQVVGAALQTPPHNIILSEMDPAIAAAFAELGRATPGVLGSPAATQGFVERWRARTGAGAELDVRERIFRIDAVIAPRPAPGRWRLAEARDRDTLVRWVGEFHTEALPTAPHRDHGDVVDRWLRGIGKTVYVWEDGEPVSFAAAGGDTPHGTRIGPVYTPRARRGRGYASNIVAAATAAQLAAGRRFCFLFTDLANPTSNKIYQALGYQPVADIHQWRFTSATG